MQDQQAQYPEPVSQPQINQPASVVKSEDPGHTFALVGIIISICVSAPVGAILSAIGYSKSKAVGIKNKLAIWGMAVGIILSIIGTIFLIIVAPMFIDFFGGIVQKCNELGPGVHKVGNTTYTCKSSNHTELDIGI